MSDDLSIEKYPNFTEYISFINLLSPKINITELVSIQHHSADCLVGWKGIKSIVCKNDNKEIYEIDIRVAWSDRVFEQHLYDFGWNQSTLLFRTNHQLIHRHKLIIYLCSPSTGLTTDVKNRVVPDQFIIGAYWHSIQHYYLLLPCQLPFDLSSQVDLTGYLDLPRAPLLAVKVDDRESIKFGGLRTKGITKSDNVNQLMISVITVVFNGKQNIEQTIQSIINQDIDNIEYIIIDGGSTDGTIDIIKKYASRIDYWISEKDLGIYDAMNKGIDLANGQWLNFMNCGDLFYSYQSLRAIPLSAHVDFYYSDTILYNSQRSTERWVCSQPKRLLVHQAIVYQKYLHSGYRYLVHDCLTVSDYFFFRKHDNKNWVKLNTPLAIYNTEGSSGGGSTSFIQKLFVNFMAGDINEFQMSLAILLKILRTPVRIIRVLLIQLKLLKSARKF